MDRPAATPKRILFAPAAGPGIGGGHVMRCLTLAEALAARGAVCAFAMNDAGATLVERFGGGSVAGHGEDVDAALRAARFDAVVIDNYAIGADQERPFRENVAALVVIDDLANRPHTADLLLDPGYGRKASVYAALLPKFAKFLVGPHYALVRSAFAELRVSALDRPIPSAPQRLFLSFGLSDIEGIASRAVALVRDRYPALSVDVALASDSQSLPDLKSRAEADPALHLHIDTADVATLMATADLAIGAGGASTWERACLGLPTLAVVVADNQRAMIEAMAADGLLLAVDLKDDAVERRFDDALADLGSLTRRQALRSASASLCDGLGASRAAEAILAL